MSSLYTGEKFDQKAYYKLNVFLKHFEQGFVEVLHRGDVIKKLRWPIFGVFFKECVGRHALPLGRMDGGCSYLCLYFMSNYVNKVCVCQTQ